MTNKKILVASIIAAIMIGTVTTSAFATTSYTLQMACKGTGIGTTGTVTFTNGPPQSVTCSGPANSGGVVSSVKLTGSIDGGTYHLSTAHLTCPSTSEVSVGTTSGLNCSDVNGKNFAALKYSSP